MHDDAQLLIHAGAPTTFIDDDKYRRQAQACLSFEAAEIEDDQADEMLDIQDYLSSSVSDSQPSAESASAADLQILMDICNAAPGMSTVQAMLDMTTYTPTRSAISPPAKKRKVENVQPGTAPVGKTPSFNTLYRNELRAQHRIPQNMVFSATLSTQAGKTTAGQIEIGDVTFGLPIAQSTAPERQISVNRRLVLPNTQDHGPEQTPSEEQRTTERTRSTAERTSTGEETSSQADEPAPRSSPAVVVRSSQIQVSSFVVDPSPSLDPWADHRAAIPEKFRDSQLTVTYSPADAIDTNPPLTTDLLAKIKKVPKPGWVRPADPPEEAEDEKYARGYWRLDPLEVGISADVFGLLWRRLAKLLERAKVFWVSLQFDGRAIRLYCFRNAAMRLWSVVYALCAEIKRVTIPWIDSRGRVAIRHPYTGDS
ncbi:hypothetical protein PYCC9005_001967 [Savitreella phatthalungensis]